MPPNAPPTRPDESAVARPAAAPSESRHPRRRAEAVAAELRAQAELGHELAQRGEDVELHGTVVNAAVGRVLAAYAVVGGLTCLLGLLRPTHALVLLAAVVLAAVVDLDHGRSWLRLLVPRDIARTVVVWRRRARGAPGRVPEEPTRQAGPRVLLCLPADAARSRTLSPWGGIPLAVALAVSGLGCALRAMGAEGTRVIGLALVAFALLFVAGLLADRFAPRSVEPASGGDLLHAVLATLHGEPLQHLDVCCAVVGGGSPFFDGASVLLLNHQNRLPRDQTTVLAWVPAPGALGWTSREGLLRARAVPPDLQDVGAALDLPPTRGRSAAGRARAHGWAAIGFRGGGDDRALVHRKLMAALRHLDEAAGAQ